MEASGGPSGIWPVRCRRPVLLWQWSIRARRAILLAPWGIWPRPTVSTRAPWRHWPRCWRGTRGRDKFRQRCCPPPSSRRCSPMARRRQLVTMLVAERQRLAISHKGSSPQHRDAHQGHPRATRYRRGPTGQPHRSAPCRACPPARQRARRRPATSATPDRRRPRVGALSRREIAAPVGLALQSRFRTDARQARSTFGQERAAVRRAL